MRPARLIPTLVALSVVLVLSACVAGPLGGQQSPSDSDSPTDNTPTGDAPDCLELLSGAESMPFTGPIAAEALPTAQGDAAGYSCAYLASVEDTALTFTVEVGHDDADASRSYSLVALGDSEWTPAGTKVLHSSLDDSDPTRLTYVAQKGRTVFSFTASSATPVDAAGAADLASLVLGRI